MTTKEKALLVYLDRLANLQLVFVQTLATPYSQDMKDEVVTKSDEVAHLLASINNLINDLYAEISQQNSAASLLTDIAVDAEIKPAE